MTAYLEAENAYTEDRTAHLADLRQAIFDEIKARTLETDLSVPTRSRGLLVLRPLLRGQGVRRQLPGPGARTGRLDAAQARRGRRSPTSRRSPARRCCSTSTSSPRATSSSPWAGRASARTARCSPTRPTWSATSATRSGSRTSATGELLHDEIAGVIGGATWDRGGRELLLHDRRRRLALRQGLAAPARHRPRPTTSSSTTRPTSGSASASAAPAATGSWSSPAAPRPRRSTGSSTRTPPTTGFRVFAERREGLEYSLDHARARRRGRLPGDAQRHRRRTSSSATAPVAPTPPEEWRPLVAHDPAVRLENVDAFAGHLVVHQRSARPDPAPDPRARPGPAAPSPTTTSSSSTTRSTRSAPAATPASTSPRSGSATPRWRSRRRSTTTTCAAAS